MIAATINTEYAFNTQTVFSDWVPADEVLEFTAADREAVARSFDDFNNGRSYTLEEADAQTRRFLASLYAHV